MKQTFKEISQGNEDIWECSEKEFVGKVHPVLQEHKNRNKLSTNVVNLAGAFLRQQFIKRELTGTIQYEVSKHIEMAMIYYSNCQKEDEDEDED